MRVQFLFFIICLLKISESACVSTDDGAVDADGDSCEEYVGETEFCGSADDGDFVANTMCCACGGGEDDGESSEDDDYSDDDYSDYDYSDDDYSDDDYSDDDSSDDMEGTVMCSGAEDFCDCEADCTEEPTWCECSEAIACCDGASSIDGDDDDDDDDDEPEIDNQETFYVGTCYDGSEMECITTNGLEYVLLHEFAESDCTGSSSTVGALLADNQNCNYGTEGLENQVICVGNEITATACDAYDFNANPNSIASGVCFENTMFLCNGDGTVSITTHAISDSLCLNTPTNTVVATADGVDCNEDDDLHMALTCLENNSIISVDYCDTNTPTMPPTTPVTTTTTPTTTEEEEEVSSDDEELETTTTTEEATPTTEEPTTTTSTPTTEEPTTTTSTPTTEEPTTTTSSTTTTQENQVFVTVQVVTFEQTFTGIPADQCDDFAPFIQESTAQVLSLALDLITVTPSTGCNSAAPMVMGLQRSTESVSFDIEIQFPEDTPTEDVDSVVQTISEPEYAADSLTAIVEIIAEDDTVTLDTQSLTVQSVSAPTKTEETILVTVTTTTTTTKPEEASTGLAGGALAGIVVGALVVVGLIAFAVYYRKVKASQGNATDRTFDDNDASEKDNA